MLQVIKPLYNKNYYYYDKGVNYNIPYSRKIWRGIKFGGLAVCLRTAKLKSANFFPENIGNIAHNIKDSDTEHVYLIIRQIVDRDKSR